MNIKHHAHRSREYRYLFILSALILLLMAVGAQAQLPAPTPNCERIVKADVVALDQVIMYNRLGTVNPAGMIFALRQDVVAIDPAKGIAAGNVRLRSDKRPRPLVLRMNNGDCLRISFQNLLSPMPLLLGDPEFPLDRQPATRSAGVHVMGMELVGDITSDASNVGLNPPSLVGPGLSAVYTFAATREGNNLLYSTAATTGGEGDGGTLSEGLFGSVNVEPRGAEWYRSQVTKADMDLATLPPLAPGGRNRINYDAVYPGTTKPILKILDSGLNIIRSDLNAIITGPNKGRFPAGTYRVNPTEPDRDQPFREFTVVYHDEIQDVQAFPQFRDKTMKHVLHSVEDKFAINYGTGGIGAEILANRLGVGPMFACTECKYEEFFLSSWTIGDPAQVVDIPANTTDINGNLILGRKATKVLYPDDPSNVHHSYIGDHVKMRVVHAGPKEHHIHHLHAHQWLQTPDDDNSTYLDSQALGPGFAFTTEITHGGSGNLNQVVGDSIFHCHFYPHFAEGMWELWRSHDVFEGGTALNANGTVATGARALPDGEILSGTPIPAIVPLPTKAMAPLPTASVPGYPFFSPAVAGHRPPHPPLDTIDDGGLSRHIITGGTFTHTETPLDFSKDLVTAIAQAIPETGTAAEIAEMQYHEVRLHPSFMPDGTPANFILNGLPRKPGAPFADPCINEQGQSVGTPRIYRAAAFQIDMKLNKAGWHYPQSRILSLWQDVAATQAGTRPPEPFFFRANTGDCITYYHTNLLPDYYELDDFQVRTPTDIVGQHIHLVKFDVTSSDGSGNGFNYEDGTFAPKEVIQRITAIRAQNNCKLNDVRNGTFPCPLAKNHPFFGTPGAQTTVQRWYADDTLNNGGFDRTLRTVFTHDHFGPSTHQQTGLYAGLVIEPRGSIWKNAETGVQLGTRVQPPFGDGGPTSWQAIIVELNQPTRTHREFMFEFADFTLAYQAGFGVLNGKPVPDPVHVINPPILAEIGLPFIVENGMVCPNGQPAPCPEAISAADAGTMTVNYRNEPVALRVRNPGTNTQANGAAGDLSKVYKSNVTRDDNAFNSQPGFYPDLTKGLKPGDPFTPLLRAYENDQVQIRILVGAHEETHNMTINGHKWLHEPGTPQDPGAINNSGYRNQQMAGISEHFEMLTGKESVMGNRPFIDYLYQNSASVDGQWNGVWGLMRVYNGRGGGLQTDLQTLPNNIEGAAPLTTNDTAFPTNTSFPTGATDYLDSTDSSVLLDSTVTTDTSLMSDSMVTSLNSQTMFFAQPIVTSLPTDFATGKSTGASVCPSTAPSRSISVTAVDASALTLAAVNMAGTLVYNKRPGNGGALNDPTAIMYFRSSDIDSNGKVKAGVPVEPLVVRAKAGECINFTLINMLPKTLADLDGFNELPPIVNHFNANQVRPSKQVGLHPQLLAYNVVNSDGKNVGFNPNQTVGPGGIARYRWYAGDIQINGNQRIATPIEFGATNLISSDPIKHSNKGAVGSLIIEPATATWIEDLTSRAQATVNKPDGTLWFREFVVQFQTDINMRFADGSPVPDLSRPVVPNPADQDGALDAEDSAQKAINYRTEPLWKRMNYPPSTDFKDTNKIDFTNSLTNAQVGGDPVTPVFTAKVGNPVRFRILNANGHMRNNVFNLHGHFWQDEPYMNFSKDIGNNPLSEVKGATYGVGPSSHYEVIPMNGAGGARRVAGDYLYRSQESFQFDGGLWGIFRVSP